MIAEKQIASEIDQLVNLKAMVRAYSELASIRMKKTRDSVLFNRKFLGQLFEVFEEVRVSYWDQVRGLSRRKTTPGGKAITFLSHNGKTVAVFLAANNRLYGELIGQTFDLFIQEVRDRGSEATIVGRAGLTIFKQTMKDKPYTYFDFPDDRVDLEAMTSLIRHLVPYEAIKIYYGKYYNTGAPKPTEFSLSSAISGEKGGGVHTTHYLFEPSLGEILKFFEKEIFGNVFEQTIRESQLAKFASRLIAMNQAEIKVGERLDEMAMVRMQVRHRVMNAKQRETVMTIFAR